MRISFFFSILKGNTAYLKLEIELWNTLFLCLRFSTFWLEGTELAQSLVTELYIC